MATIFRNLFRHKKSQSKEDASAGDEVLERDSSRRSWRASKSRVTRFADDNMLPPTAAYHTNNAPKLRKGPQSCPGGYGDEYDCGNSHRSFAVDNYKENKRSRHNQQPSSSSYHHQPHKSRSSRYTDDRQHYSSRWETSEYGSENTSPIGSHHRHYESHLDDDDDEKDTDYEDSKVQEIKQRFRRHYEDKLYDYEMKRLKDRSKIKELEKEKQTIEKEKNDVVKIMIQQNDKLEKEKKKVEYYKRKANELEQQLNQMRSGFGGFGMFPSTPHHQQTMFPSFGSSSSGQRFSFMGSSVRPISTSNTPTTSAMDTTGGGAGESLVPASDLSLVQIPPMQSIHVDLPQNVPTGGQIGKFSGFDDDEEDETKNFRTVDTPSLSIEMPRSSIDTSFIRESIISQTNLEPLTEVKDEGYSTTPDDACNSAKKETTPQ
ncbi:unnamed protein product [Caenorhabditis bovis]|uniref:Uncharacterized protein n=1 Tax=Caenorhabditis bovis TaxID=2654633 RepID=A0A8S1EK90_9PELO|nr:unnamed protein product [Caenorhabditis bovis]